MPGSRVGENNGGCVFLILMSTPQLPSQEDFISLCSHQCVTEPIPLPPYLYMIISVILCFASWRAKNGISLLS